MSLLLNESLILAKTRCQDLHSVYKLNCWGSGIKDVSLVRKLINVEVIGLSCNEITTLEDFAHCPKLKELILRKNKIEDIAEIAYLQGLTKLTSLWLGENPCAENTYNYRKVVLKALPNLTMLDNIPVTREELQEIEELGNDIYEEIPYESSHSSGSAQSSSTTSNPLPSVTSKTVKMGVEHLSESYGNNSTNNTSYTQQQQQQEEYTNQTEYTSDLSFQPTNEIRDSSLGHSGCPSSNLNESRYTAKTPQRPQSRASAVNSQHCRSLTSQDSNSSLFSQNQGWSMSNINNNNVILPKGGRVRNSNILSAILCLVKELDYSGCEVVQTALHCRMEEIS